MSRLIYVGDPMCSWCWGFAPEVEALAARHHIELVVGGLRPGPAAQVLDDRLAGFLRHHWVEIAERTGQPFDTGFLDRRDGWLYDTEPAAIAVVAVREMAPESTLDYFVRVQRAFYAEGRDVTDSRMLVSLATESGLDPARFRDLTSDEAVRKRTWSDFSRARGWGIGGFPSLLARLDDGRLALVARGWTEAGVVEERLERLTATV